MSKTALLIFAIVTALVFQACARPGRKERNMMDPKRYFEGAQLRLADAIDKDSTEAIAQAVASGAKVDEPGKEGVTPLMYALVVKKKNAVAELLGRGADANKRAENKQNGMTLGARLAKFDLDYLRLLLAHKGDPNTREPDNDPILITMIDQLNNEGIRLLASGGANVNILDRTGKAAILVAGYADYWDCVWTLIDLGADWTVTDSGVTLAWLAHMANLHSDSPIYPWLKRCVDFMKARGVVFPPLSPQQVLSGERAKP
jgi:ankyrin repeat protein